jgi:sugar phosphate isomerase/epimerase
MLIGASLGSFKRLELHEAIDLYDKLSNKFNLNAIEINFAQEMDKPTLRSWGLNNKLIKLLSNFTITGAHLPFAYLNPISSNPRIRVESLEKLKLGMATASALNMTYVTMHARGFANGLTHNQKLNEWEQVIAELALYAQEMDILLTVENADNLMNLKELVGIINKIGSKWLKITLDIGHAHMRRPGSNPLYTLPHILLLKAMDATFNSFLSNKYMPFEEYGTIKDFLLCQHDLIFNLHIHDYNGIKDHITIGQGKIDFSFMAALNHSKIVGILEVGLGNPLVDFGGNYKRLKLLLERGL